MAIKSLSLRTHSAKDHSATVHIRTEFHGSEPDYDPEHSKWSYCTKLRSWLTSKKAAVNRWIEGALLTPLFGPFYEGEWTMGDSSHSLFLARFGPLFEDFQTIPEATRYHVHICCVILSNVLEMTNWPQTLIVLSKTGEN